MAMEGQRDGSMDGWMKYPSIHAHENTVIHVHVYVNVMYLKKDTFSQYQFTYLHVYKHSSFCTGSL